MLADDSSDPPTITESLTSSPFNVSWGKFSAIPNAETWPISFAGRARAYSSFSQEPKSGKKEESEPRVQIRVFETIVQNYLDSVLFITVQRHEVLMK